MASKTYTAKQMRDAALFAETVEVPDQFHGQVLDGIAAMLRQAANAMERKKKREKKREKKYEYSVHPADVYGVFQHRSAAELNVNFFKALGVRTHLVRREVGEWEKVKK